MEQCAGDPAVILCRVSTRCQEAENQLLVLRDYCQRRGWRIVQEVMEVEHGNVPGRSALNEIKQMAHQRRFKVLVVWAMDRLTREGIGPLLSHLQYFEKCGVAVVSYQEEYLSTTGPARDLLLSIIAWVAAYERKRISERTKAGLQRKINLGQRLGRPKGSGDRRPRNARADKGLKRGPPRSRETKAED